MKFLLLALLPMVSLCSAGRQSRPPVFHSELNTAVRDLTRIEDPAIKTALLDTINNLLLGGHELERTHYTLEHITDSVPRETLEREARERSLFGILRLLGYCKITIDDE